MFSKERNAQKEQNDDFTCKSLDPLYFTARLYSKEKEATVFFNFVWLDGI